MDPNPTTFDPTISSSPPESDEREVDATSSARVRAGELDVDLATVEGTGRDGRVTAGDVERVAAELDAQAEEDAQCEPESPPESQRLNDASWPVVCFHCPTNPNFHLVSRRLHVEIRFSDGYYETEDPAKIRALRACESVQEV